MKNMNPLLKYPVRKFFAILLLLFANPILFAQMEDTSYISIAPSGIQQMIVPGTPPVVTIQVSGYYNIGLLDLAANDNTSFNKSDFVNGRNFGTRYGYGVSITGKLSLHKEGNIRLTVTPSFQRFQSNFIIASSKEGSVSYNVLSGAIGIEDNFTPYRQFKPYVGFDVVGSAISGSAVLKTDSTDFNLNIKSSFRIGFDLNFGFEYAFNNNVGVNLGMKLTHANAILRKSQTSSNPNETYLNDEHVTPQIPYSGWKQFLYSSFYGGINFYFGMKNKK